MREYFERENVAANQIRHLQAREAQLLANLHSVGLRNQQSQQVMNRLRNSCNQLQLAFDRSRVECAALQTALQNSEADHRATGEAFQIAMNNYQWIAVFFTALSEVPDEAEGVQRVFHLDDMIVDSHENKEAIEKLGEAVRRTVARARQDAEAMKEMMFNERETAESVIHGKDDRIGDLLLQIKSAKVKRSARELSSDPDNRKRRNPKRKGDKESRPQLLVDPMNSEPGSELELGDVPASC